MFFLEKVKSGKILMGIFCAVALLECVPAQAQFVLPKRKINQVEPLSPKERWSLKTNTVDWLLQMANASVEYSLSSDPYSKFTLVASGRVNWGSEPEVPTYNQFNLAGGRIEIRSYWHNRGRDPQNKYAGITDKLFSHERFDARTWRGYYVGLYGGYDYGKIKLGRSGYKGPIYQVGLSYGLVRPIYNYKNSVLDMEFGVNVGAAYLNGTKYYLDRSGSTPKYVDGNEKKGFLPFPVVSDVSVSLVYRYGPSVKNRNRYNQAKHIAAEERKAERRRIQENQREDHEKEVAEKKAAQEEAKAAKKAAQEELKAAKKAAQEQNAEAKENAEQVNKEAKKQAAADKKAAGEAAKAAKKAEKEAQKAAQKAAKEAEKAAKNAEKE